MTTLRRLIVLALPVALFACSSDSAVDAPNESSAMTTTAPTTAAPPTDAPGPASTAAPVDTAAATTAPAADQCADPASGEPYKFGHVNIVDSGIDIPSAFYALEVFVDQYNECGGFNGRPIEIIAESGGVDPGTTAGAARKLIEADGVIGFVGSNSFFDCLGNGQYYAEQQIAVLASSFDGTCFTNEVIFPHLANFDRNIFPGIKHALENGKSKFAYMALDIPGSQVQADAITAYLEANGASLVTTALIPFGATDPTTGILQIKQSGADIVIASADENTLAAGLSTAIQQGIGPKDIMWVSTTGLYSPRALATMGEAADGMLITANHDVVENASAVAQTIADGIAELYPDEQIDGFAQLGWIAGEVLAATLAEVDGELTKESLLAAAQSVGPIQSDLLPGPIEINGALPRQLQSYGLMLVINNGAFEVLDPNWIVYPS
jgi:branched-chain amino acid transport system substrate-binding protein